MLVCEFLSGYAVKEHVSNGIEDVDGCAGLEAEVERISMKGGGQRRREKVLQGR